MWGLATPTWGAIIREAKEEINLDIRPEDIEFVAKLKTTANRYMRAIYLLHSDITPQFNPHDFVSAKWLAPEVLISSIDSGHPAKMTLRSTVLALQTYLAGA